MTRDDLKYLKEWFSSYAKGYYSSDEEDQRNIMLKVVHTDNVCRNILEIAAGEGLDENMMMLAETVALLHDAGRFPQYARYRTFRDADSISHGRLGAETIIRENILAGLPAYERELILFTVRFHGAFRMPAAADTERLGYLKLVRDADKVDIFRVFIEYYESPVEKRASATAFGVPDTPECSAFMLSCIMNRCVAPYSKIRTENDFRLMKLSWIFDMHFDTSVRLLRDRGCIENIIKRLPQTDEVREAVGVLRGYVKERLGDGQKG